MRVASIISILMFAQIAFSQSNYPDSLISLLGEAPNDSVRFSINHKISGYYFNRDRRKTFEFNEEALKIARKNNMTLDVAACLDTKGYYLNKEDRYGESLKCYIEGFKLAEDPASEKQTWLKPADADPYKYRMQVLAGLHHDLGHVMRSTGNNKEAIQQFRICLHFLDKALPTSHNSALMNIGAVYLDLNILDSAMYYQKKALAGMHMTYRPTMYKYMADIYFRQGNTDSARYYYHQGVELATKQKGLSQLVTCQMGLAQIYLAAENKDSSLFYARAFMNGFKELHGNPVKDINISIAYELLYRAYQLLGQQDSTLKYLNLAFTSSDSISRARILNLTQYQNLTFNEQRRLQDLEQEKILTQNKIRVYALIIGLGVFLLIAIILYRNSHQKQKANNILQETLSNLRSTQTQLIHAEKMASLGELTAGIAHEIQNPLNFVNNFSDVSVDLIKEMNEELNAGNAEDAKAIGEDLKQNLEKISHHGKRASGIVKGMLEHSRAGDGEKELTDLNGMADEYLRLAYHGLRAKDKSFNASYKTDLDENLPRIKVVPQDISRVLLNLINNAFYACADRSRSTVSIKSNDMSNKTYVPTVTVCTTKLENKIQISIKDNGSGIPQDHLDKIFLPFFTTKPTGQGTGLGLSMSYDIITKGYNGELLVTTKNGEGSEFIIVLPINQPK